MDNVLKAAYIGGIASIAAAVIGLGGHAISKGGSGASEGASSTTVGAPALSSGRCAEMLREVRGLPRGDPELADEFARQGDAELPSLWSVNEIRQCGGVDPERLLEGRLAPSARTP